MAVGDVVSQTSTSSFTFQPASGVQVCVTQFMTTNDSYQNSLYGRGDIYTSDQLITSNGFQTSYYLHLFAGVDGGRKWFIDNSSYLYFVATSSKHGGFSGIQTQ